MEPLVGSRMNFSGERGGICQWERWLVRRGLVEKKREIRMLILDTSPAFCYIL